MKPLSIGQVSSRSGVGVETIRFYERHGLLEKPSRRQSGYRQYSEDVVERLRFIRRAKELGFSLTEIAELLSLGTDSDLTCDEVKARALAKMDEIQARIEDLQRVREALAEVATACEGRATGSDCPLLEALARQEMRTDEQAEA